MRRLFIRGKSAMLFPFLLFSILSCSGPEKPAEYFPLIDGATYVYNHGESRRVVSFYKKENQYDLYKVMNFVNDTAFVMVDYYIQTDSTVFWYGFRSLDYGLVYFNPPVPLIPTLDETDSLLVARSEEIHALNTGERRYKIKLNYHFLGKERVTVPAGTFQCVRFRYSVQYIGDIPEIGFLLGMSGDWWFARGVGLVKQTSEEYTLELTSFEK